MDDRNKKKYKREEQNERNTYKNVKTKKLN